MQRLIRPPRRATPIAPAQLQDSSPNPIAHIYGLTVILLLPLIVLTIALPPNDTEIANWYNGTATIYLIAVTGLAAYRIARAAPSALWSPAFWILVSSAVFFGFGPLVEIYGNDETQSRLSAARIAISEIELFNSNRLSLISIVALLLGFWLHTRLRSEVWRAALTKGRTREPVVFEPQTLAMAFIVGGMILVHGITMPSQWGQLDVVVPGALATVAPIVDVGFALAVFQALRGSKSMWLPLVLLWPLHLFLTALSFAKAGLVLALLLPAIGAYLAHRNIFRLAAAALAIAIVFNLSQDFVHYGRGKILQDTGTIWQAGYAERIRITASYFSLDDNETSISRLGEEEQGWWMRLNYSGVQAVGMRFRDDGVFLDSLRARSESC